MKLDIAAKDGKDKDQSKEENSKQKTDANSTDPNFEHQNSWQSDPTLWKPNEPNKDTKTSEVASATERFLHNKLAPELLSFEGRVVVLTIYLVMLIGALYGCLQVKIDFSVDYFITSDSYIYEYYQLNDKYFQQGFSTTIFVDDPTIDYASAET